MADDEDQRAGKSSEFVQREREKRQKLTEVYNAIRRGEAPPPNMQPPITLLSFGESDIRDLSPLKDLVDLESLFLDQTPVADLRPLAGLRNLRLLILDETHVTDLCPIAHLVSLETLRLAGTQVRDLAPIAALPILKVLVLSGTPVADLSPLEDVTSLRALDVSRTQITDLTPLARLPKLESVPSRRGQNYRPRADSARQGGDRSGRAKDVAARAPPEGPARASLASGPHSMSSPLARN